MRKLFFDPICGTISFPDPSRRVEMIGLDSLERSLRILEALEGIIAWKKELFCAILPILMLLLILKRSFDRLVLKLLLARLKRSLQNCLSLVSARRIYLESGNI